MLCKGCAVSWPGNRESRIANRESGIGNRESGIGSRKSESERRLTHVRARQMAHGASAAPR
ncbi:AraC family transcriptional regulator [Xanthomonas vasicola pv. vasculorum]|nr:AraC family transcriptional regulator [Xanthomonas vasicola pv. vasculorum]